MARHKEFDRDQALAAAVRTFWQRGYGGTSVRDLVDSMGVHRASLYDTYGSKQSLFAEVLRSYSERVFATVFAPLSGTGSPLARLRTFFASVVEALSGADRYGCLIVKSAVDSDDDLHVLRPLVAEHTARVDGAFASLLAQARAAGEIRPDADERKLARHLRNSFYGLCVSASVGADATELTELTDQAVACLR